MAEGISRFNNPELARAQEPAPDTAESLREQIRQHEFIDQHRGLLDRATTDLLNRGDENSLAAMQDLQKRVDQGTVKQGEIAAAVKADRDAMNFQNEVSMYGTGFLKAATLFLPGKGKIPWIAAGAVSALDQIKIAPDVSAGEVVLDGTLGFAKGAGMKVMMDKVGGTTWRTWEKGLVIGGAGGALETGLHRENWLNKDGNLDIGLGLGRTTQSTLFGAGTGAVTFAVGQKLFKGLSATTGGALEQSGLASNMGVGFSFGVTGGFTSEAMNQMKKGQFDPVQLAVRSLLQGGVDMFAGGTGYKAGRFYMPEAPGPHPVFSEKEQGPSLMQQLKGVGEKFFKPSDPNSDSTFAGRTKRRGGDDYENEGGNGDWRDQLERLSRQNGWGSKEEPGGDQGGNKGKGEKKVVADTPDTTGTGDGTGDGTGTVKNDSAPVIDESLQQRVVPAEKLDTKVVPASAELDAGQAALQARLDALAAEGKLKGVQNMGAMKLYQRLPDLLRQANGDQPIPEMELKVIKDNQRYQQLPDMIAQAVRKAEASRTAEPRVGDTDEIVSGGDHRSTSETGDPYADLLRRAAEGEKLDPLEARQLEGLHENRMSADLDKLSLEERIAETKRTLEAEKQAAEKGSEAPVPPEGFQKGEAIWRNKEHDVPVEVEAYLGEQGGRHYVKVKDQNTGIPLDEIVYPEKPENLERPAELTGDQKVVNMPDVDVVKETNGMFGTTYTQGNRLLKEAVTSAYLAVVGEGQVASDAAGHLRKIVTATDGNELKPALEMIAANHPEIEAVIKTALDGVETPEPKPQQITLKDIETHRPHDLATLMNEGIDLASRAVNGDAAAQAQLKEFAQRSVDATDPANPVFDVQEGMMKVARAYPELSRTVYDAFQDTLSNKQLVEFGTKFVKESVAGDAEATRLLDEFARNHNHAEVKRGMIDAAKQNVDIADAVYDRYKDALTLDDKFWYGGKYLADATNNGQAGMDRLLKFARENPDSEVLSFLRYFTDMNPQYKDAFYEGFGQLEGPRSDVPAVEAAGKLIDARLAELLGQPAAEQSALPLITEISEALNARMLNGESYQSAQDAISKNLDRLARLKGLDDTDFLKQAVKEAAWPTDAKTLTEADKVFDAVIARQKAEEAGTALPPEANPLEFIREINEAVKLRKAAGMRTDDAAAALKKNLDRLAQSKGLDNADFLNDSIVEAIVPSMSDGEDSITRIGKEQLEMQIADKKAKAENGERTSLPDGEQYVRAVWAEMMDYMGKGFGKNIPDMLSRARQRLEIQAALNGEPDANDMLPFLAEAGTFAHQSGARPGPENLTVDVTPENQADVTKRVADFRQIANNSKLPQDPEFTGTLQERMNQWFEHQMGVRRDLFDWLNNNKDLWGYAQDYAAATQFSPIAAMIDSYPHTDTRFLNDFPSYQPGLFAPKPPRVEVPRDTQDIPEDQQPTDGQAQINPTIAKAIENMNSGDGDLQLAGATESQYLMNPRARGVEQFSRWRQIMSANVDRLPPAYKSLFNRPDLDAIPDDVLMEFLSANKAEAAPKKGGWSWEKDMPEARVSHLEQALDAFKTADMKDPTKADQPGMADATQTATALGVKLAKAVASDRPLLDDILFKIGDTAPFRTKYKQMISAMLENSDGTTAIKGVMEKFNEIQAVRQTYQPRVPKGQPRVAMTPEATQEMMGKIQQIIDQARAIALQTNPSDPNALSKMIYELGLGTAERDATPFKPKQGGGGDRKPPRQ